MGFIRNLFAKANTIDRLADERDYLQSCLDRETYRNGELEKQIIKERNRVDKFLLRYADNLSVKNGLYAKFTQDAKELEPQKESAPEPVSEKITWAAEKNREADVQFYGEENVQPIEVYVKEISENPEQFIL